MNLNVLAMSEIGDVTVKQEQNKGRVEIIIDELGALLDDLSATSLALCGVANRTLGYPTKGTEGEESKGNDETTPLLGEISNLIHDIDNVATRLDADTQRLVKDL